MENSHVVSAVLRPFNEAKRFVGRKFLIWGIGNLLRKFLHVEDMDCACLYTMALPRHKYSEITVTQLSHI
ncbi:NAD-dependent epimerase/dehydratase family protein [Parahaliea maris]|uniref:NAD-dependent epimerase/dehydratase family protein n=1 Tax=Parahaliea maris TaxID=2716870 RepID=UPI0038B2AAE5